MEGDVRRDDGCDETNGTDGGPALDSRCWLRGTTMRYADPVDSKLW